MNKRGQGLSTNAIILIVLGVVVLAVLVIGFIIGWGKISPFVSSDNVATISNQCTISCSTNSIYDFCSRGRDLKEGGKTYKSVTCNYISQKLPKYAIEKCPSVSCSNVVLIDSAGIKDINGLKAKCDGNSGKIIQTLVDDSLLSYNCP